MIWDRLDPFWAGKSNGPKLDIIFFYGRKDAHTENLTNRNVHPSNGQTLDLKALWWTACGPLVDEVDTLAHGPANV